MLSLVRARACAAAVVRVAGARHGSSTSAPTSFSSSSSSPRSAHPDTISDEESANIFRSAKDAMYRSKVAHTLREKVFAPDFQVTKENLSEKERELLRLWRVMEGNPALRQGEGGGPTPSETGAMDPQTTTWEGASGATAAAAAAGRTDHVQAAKSACADAAPVNAAEVYGQTFKDCRPMDPSEPTEAKRRRLIFQSRYRGMVEMDLILGHFARCRLESLDASLLDEYDTLLKQLDNDLFRWLIMGSEKPAEIESMRCYQALKKFVDEERAELLGSV